MKKAGLWVMIASLVLLAGTIGVLISMRGIDRQAADSTTFCQATVTEAHVVSTGKDLFAEIHTEEYSAALYVSTNVCKRIDAENISALRRGQKIFFGVENQKAQQLNRTEFVDITALGTEAGDIFSLEEYNAVLHQAAQPARIAGLVMAGIFLVIALLCALRIRRK